LARAGGQAERAARDLGVSRQGLRKLMSRLGMMPTVSATRPAKNSGAESSGLDDDSRD
jgi:hypothetical protein